MSLKQRLKKWIGEDGGKPDRKLQDPKKGKDRPVKVDPIERLAALIESGIDFTVELYRKTGGGRGAVQRQWHITEVNLLEFYSQVSDALGGGTYRMTFRQANGELYKLEGSNEEEAHVFTIAGKPKLTGEKETKDKEASNPLDWINKIMAEGSGIALLLKLFMESKDKSTEMMMEMLKAQLGNGNGKIDSSAMLANVTETLVKLKEAAQDSGGADPMQYIAQFMDMFNKFSQTMRPPVSTTGSNKSGLDSFFESLGQAAPSLVPMIAGAMGNRAAEPAPTPPPHMENTLQDQQKLETQREAFAGPGEAETKAAPDPANMPKFSPLAAFKAPDLGGADELTAQSAAFGATYKLRYMIVQQADPLDIASEMVDVINLIQGARRVDGVWENYIDDPGEAFDNFAPLIDEWAEHPQFKNDCRAAMVKAVTDYYQEDEAEVEEAAQVGSEEAEPHIIEAAEIVQETPVENDDSTDTEKPVRESLESTETSETPEHDTAKSVV